MRGDQKSLRENSGIPFPDLRHAISGMLEPWMDLQKS
jgi:hypothetical protein